MQYFNLSLVRFLMITTHQEQPKKKKEAIYAWHEVHSVTKRNNSYFFSLLALLDNLAVVNGAPHVPINQSNCLFITSGKKYERRTLRESFENCCRFTSHCCDLLSSLVLPTRKALFKPDLMGRNAQRASGLKALQAIKGIQNGKIKVKTLLRVRCRVSLCISLKHVDKFRRDKKGAQ